MAERGFKPGEFFRRNMFERVANTNWDDEEVQDETIRRLESTIFLLMYSQQAQISNRIKMYAKESYFSPVKKVKEKRAIDEFRRLKKQKMGMDARSR